MKARRLLNRIPERVVLGSVGIVAAVSILLLPTFLAWWVRLFI